MITCYIRTLTEGYLEESQWHRIAQLIDAKEVNIFYIILKIELSIEGKEPISFEDTFETLIRNLLLKSSLELLHDRDYQFNFMDYHGEILMLHEKNHIRLEGDFIQTTSFPLKQLVQLFLTGAEKTMKLMQTLHEIHPEFEYEAYAQFADLYSEAKKLYEQKF